MDSPKIELLPVCPRYTRYAGIDGFRLDAWSANGQIRVPPESLAIHEGCDQ